MEKFWLEKGCRAGVGAQTNFATGRSCRCKCLKEGRCDFEPRKLDFPNGTPPSRLRTCHARTHACRK